MQNPWGWPAVLIMIGVEVSDTVKQIESQLMQRKLSGSSREFCWTALARDAGGEAGREASDPADFHRRTLPAQHRGHQAAWKPTLRMPVTLVPSDGSQKLSL